MKIAVIGSGISGLVAAHLLSSQHELTVFEANDYIGGHTNTLQVSVDGSDFNIDTGFIVFNELNYPLFTQLLTRLGVKSQPSSMSFSVSCEQSGLEYNGTSLNTLFAQRRNLLNPRFFRMVKDITRFYREASELIGSDDYSLQLGQYLSKNRYSHEFIEKHIIPMGAAIWSTGREKIREFPARYFVEFFKNHGFLQVKDRPAWRVIQGGSKQYIPPLIEPFKDRVHLNSPVRSVRRTDQGVEVRTNQESYSFDQVVVATHSDQALELLTDPTEQEREILGSIKYQSNETVLHTDESLLPGKRLARASWNYFLPREREHRPTVTYYMNFLQSLQSEIHFCVTLNRTEDIEPSKILKKFNYEHPVYTVKTLRAQSRRSEINGQNRTHYCGAYWGYGFHEDGVKSAVDVVRQFGIESF